VLSKEELRKLAVMYPDKVQVRLVKSKTSKLPAMEKSR